MGMTGPAEDQNTTTALVTNGIRGVNLGGREDTSPRIWSGGNSLKLGQNYAYRNPNLLQLLGDFVPRPPLSGLRPWTPLGDFCPPDPMHRTSPTFCTRLTPLNGILKRKSQLFKHELQNTPYTKRVCVCLCVCWFVAGDSLTGLSMSYCS